MIFIHATDQSYWNHVIAESHKLASVVSNLLRTMSLETKFKIPGRRFPLSRQTTKTKWSTKSKLGVLLVLSSV